MITFSATLGNYQTTVAAAAATQWFPGWNTDTAELRVGVGRHGGNVVRRTSDVPTDFYLTPRNPQSQPQSAHLVSTMIRWMAWASIADTQRPGFLCAFSPSAPNDPEIVVRIIDSSGRIGAYFKASEEAGYVLIAEEDADSNGLGYLAYRRGLPVHFEGQILRSASGYFRLWLDGTLVLENASFNSVGSTGGVGWALCFGSQGANYPVEWESFVAWNNVSASQSGLFDLTAGPHGPHDLEYVPVTGTVTSEWTTSGAANAHSAVDDSDGHNGDTDYIQSTASTQVALFSHPALSVITDPTALVVHFVSKTDNASTQVAALLRAGSTDQQGHNRAHNVGSLDAYWYLHQGFARQPGGSTWTVEAIDDIAFGVRQGNYSGTGTRITNTWGEVLGEAEPWSEPPLSEPEDESESEPISESESEPVSESESEPTSESESEPTSESESEPTSESESEPASESESEPTSESESEPISESESEPISESESEPASESEPPPSEPVSEPPQESESEDESESESESEGIPMELTFRTGGPWGPGKGANLVPSEPDWNFWILYNRLLAVESNTPQPVEIVNVTVTDNKLTVHMADGSHYGPFDLPPPALMFDEGGWKPNTDYERFTLFVHDNNLYMVLQSHTSDSIFNPNSPDYFLVMPFPSVYDIGFFYPGTPGQGIDSSEAMFTLRATRAFYVPENFAGSEGGLQAAAASTITLSVLKNNSAFGTITINAASDEATFAGTATQFEVGDRLRVLRPASLDATAKDLSLTIAGVLGELPSE